MKYLKYLPLVQVVLMAMASPALAQDLSPVSDMIDTIVTALTGPIGRGLTILAVIATGYAMFVGRLNWMFFVAVLVGAVMVFSAETIVDGFGAEG